MIITGGKYKGQKIIAPNEKITRPTLSKVRQGVFNTLYSLIGDFNNKTFLDMFGGSGIMGLEALSRGFDNVIVFEKNSKVAQVLKNNYLKLKQTPNLLIGDSLKLIKKIQTDIDVIYIDPPYYSGIYEEIFKELKKLELKNTIIVSEHSLPIKIEDFELIKTKSYGDKIIYFFR